MDPKLIPQGLRDNPGRVADRHVSFVFEPRLEGNHIHVKVRSASRIPSVQVDNSRGLAGELVLSPGEWELLATALGSIETPGPTWFLDRPTHSLGLVCGAGHPDLAEEEHPGQRFVEVRGLVA